jgi:hypothetical protein
MRALTLKFTGYCPSEWYLEECEGVIGVKEWGEVK